MPIATGHYTLDLSKLPSKADELRVRFEQQVVNGKNVQLLIYPDAEPGFEPSYVRYATGMSLQLGDGTVAGRLGQLVVTGQRLVGMITGGSVGNAALDASHGAIYVFSIDLDDCYGPVPKTNWRGKPVEAMFRSKEDQRVAFMLHVFSMVATVKNGGEVAYTSLPRLLEHLTPEGRQRLQT